MGDLNKPFRELQLSDTSAAYLEDVAHSIQDQTESVKDLVLKWKQALAGLEDHDHLQSNELRPIIQAIQQINVEHNKTNKSRQRTINVLLQLPTMDLPAVQNAFEEAYFNRDLDTIRMMAVCEDINPHCNVEKLKSALSKKPEYHALRAYSNNPDYLASVGAVREQAAYQKIKDASGIDIPKRSYENLQRLREQVGKLTEKETAFKARIIDFLEQGNFYLAHDSNSSNGAIVSKNVTKFVDKRNDKKAIAATDKIYSLDTRQAMGGDTSDTATFREDVKFGNSDFVFTWLHLGQPKDVYVDTTVLEPGKLPQGCFFNERDWLHTREKHRGLGSYYQNDIPEALALLIIKHEREEHHGKIESSQNIDTDSSTIANSYLYRKELLIPNRLTLTKTPDTMRGIE